jgi:iron complex outermembrane receptor protein
VRIPSGNTASYVPGTRMRNFTYQGSDTVLHLGNDLEIADDLWLTTGLAAIYTRRESAVTYPQSGGKTSMRSGSSFKLTMIRQSGRKVSGSRCLRSQR